jgi:hypothetical protein
MFDGDVSGTWHIIMKLNQENINRVCQRQIIAGHKEIQYFWGQYAAMNGQLLGTRENIIYLSDLNILYT